MILECPVSGDPEPKVKWLKNGETLQLHARMELKAGGRQLEIEGVQESDTAHYTCIAVNEAGELKQHFELEILGENVRF